MGLWKFLTGWLGSKKKEATLLCVGLDNSGKSTILKQFKAKNAQSFDTAPTMGFKVETFRKSNIKFVAFDMSGQGKYRDLWERHYATCDGMIFVIDSSDQMRIAVAKEELNHILDHPDVKSKPQLPILFFANKSDIRSSLPALKCAQLLGLDGTPWKGNDFNKQTNNSRPWYICSSNARTGEGLEDGITWLSQRLVSMRTLET